MLHRQAAFPITIYTYILHTNERGGPMALWINQTGVQEKIHKVSIYKEEILFEEKKSESIIGEDWHWHLQTLP